MTGHQPILCNLLFLALVTQARSSMCTNNWFGTNCNFRCHCLAKPCKSNGICDIRDNCQNGWFYEACQYNDLLYQYKDKLTDYELTDNNDYTCLKENSSITEIRVGLTIYIRFFFIRLIMSDNAGDQGTKLDLAFNDSRVPCVKGRRYILNMRIIDFECDLQEPINVIIVRGAGATYLCDIYISGGQNLALLQDTSMSSVGIDPLNEPFHSSLAVDGRPHSIDRCARTDTIQKYNQTFTLVFRSPVLLMYITIFSGPRFRDNLGAFVLVTLDKDNNVIEHYRNAGSSRGRYFIALNEIKTAVTSILIMANVSHGIMEICEIETYGVPVCEPGRYDYACSSTCTCVDNTCAPHSGSCLHSCVSGYYGPSCGLSCPESCYPPGVCDSLNGACFSCAVGYSGQKCEQACTTGTHGVDCLLTCSTTCKDNACHPSTGYCQSCNDGYYGNYCNVSCPENCLDRLCDSTGQCFNCSPGFYDEACSSVCSSACLDKICNVADGQCILCTDGYYGLKCSSLCPVHCSDKKCDRLTGNCSSCEAGYFAEDCSASCPGKCFDGKCDMLNGSCIHDCADGYFGSSCSSECPSACKNNRCNKISGLCVACDNTYGTYCSISCPSVCANKTCGRYTGNCLFCEPGFFGFHCIHKCPTNCANNQCHIKNGNCTSCISGYHGKLCDKMCPRDCLQPTCDIRTAQCVKATVTQSGAYIYVIIGSVASFLVTAALLLYKKRRQNSGDVEEDEDDDDDEDLSSDDSLSNQETKQEYKKQSEPPKEPTLIKVIHSEVVDKP